MLTLQAQEQSIKMCHNVQGYVLVIVVVVFLLSLFEFAIWTLLFVKKTGGVVILVGTEVLSCWWTVGCNDSWYKSRNWWFYMLRCRSCVGRVIFVVRCSTVLFSLPLLIWILFYGVVTVIILVVFALPPFCFIFNIDMLCVWWMFCGVVAVFILSWRRCWSIVLFINPSSFYCFFL